MPTVNMVVQILYVQILFILQIIRNQELKSSHQRIEIKLHKKHNVNTVDLRGQ